MPGAKTRYILFRNRYAAQVTKYDLFLSHSSSDEAAAGAIHRALRQFARRWLAVRALRVFRYVTSMSADPELWESLKKAMHESRFLVLLASPSSAASTYVLREIDEWIRQGKGHHLLILLLDGSIVWDSERNDFDWERTTALSPALAKRFRAEPRYVDVTKVSRDSFVLRNPVFKDAIATIAAPVHGRSKEELVGDDVRHRRGRALAVGSAMAAIVLLALVAAWQGQRAIQRQEEAVRARSRALSADGRRLWLSNEPRRAVAFMAQSIRVNPGDLSATTQLIAWLTHHPWARWPVVVAPPGKSGAIARHGTSVSVVREGSVKLFDLAGRVLGPTLTKPGTAIEAAAFTTRSLATASASGDIDLWQDGRHIAGCHIGWKPGDEWVVSPDDRLIASVSGEDIKVWATVDCRVVAGTIAHDTRDLTFSPDGTHLFETSIESARVIELGSSGTEAVEHTFDAPLVVRQWISPGQTALLAGMIQSTQSRNYVVKIWRPADRETARDDSLITHGFPGEAVRDFARHDAIHVAILPGSETLLTLCSDGTLERRVVDNAGGITQKPFESTPLDGFEKGRGLYFGAGDDTGRLVFVAGDDGFGAVYDIVANRQINSYNFGKRPVARAFLAAANNALVVQFDDGGVEAHLLAPRVSRAVVLPHERISELGVRDDWTVEYLPAGAPPGSVVLGDGDNRVWSWRAAADAVDGKCLAAPTATDTHYWASFDSSSRPVLVGDSGRILVFDESGNPVMSFAGSGKAEGVLGRATRGHFVLRPDREPMRIVGLDGGVKWQGACAGCAVRGARVATAVGARPGVADAEIRIVEVSPSQSSEWILGVRGRRLALDPEGKHLVLTSSGAIKVVDLDSRSVTWSRQFDSVRQPFGVFGTRSSQIVVRLFGREEVHLFDTTKDAVIASLTGDAADVAVSPDTTVAVSFARDSERLRFHRADTGERIGDDGRHGSNIEGVAFSSDSRWLVVRSRSAVSVWDARTAQLVLGPLDATALGTLARDESGAVTYKHSGRAVVLEAGFLDAARLFLILSWSPRSMDANAYVLDFLRPTTPAPEWLPPLAETIAGLSVTTAGDVAPVPEPDVRLSALRAAIERSGSLDEYAIWGRWVTGGAAAAFANVRRPPAACDTR